VQEAFARAQVLQDKRSQERCAHNELLMLSDEVDKCVLSRTPGSWKATRSGRPRGRSRASAHRVMAGVSSRHGRSECPWTAHASTQPRP